MFRSNYFQALEDYRKARRNASIQELLARLSGNPEDSNLLSYDDVRQQLQAIEKSAVHLADIPLNAIIGSVGRYHDFTRKFLPKKTIDQNRWAQVMATSQGLSGLPPIEVYQIGESYFVKDGNHRVSTARQMGNTEIQAYITEVETKVDLPADTTPDELIIKSEQVRFLEITSLDQSIPDVDLSATTPGAYPTLLEHIKVHRYYLGISSQREISFEEASLNWYREIYLPVRNIITQRDLLSEFPDRTAIDLYLWAAEHRAGLSDQIGWDIGPEAALSDLSDQHTPLFRKPFQKGIGQLVSKIIPDRFESGPPPGTWREKLLKMTVLESLFSNIIVALDDSANAWNALNMAILLGKSERSSIRGIHIHSPTDQDNHQDHNHHMKRFEDNCRSGGISDFNFTLVEGEIWKVLLDRSRFADLVILPLNHPPGDKPAERLSSGITTMIRSCAVPVMTVPGPPRELNNLVLAYDASLKAKEALFIAAYLGTQLGSSLKVLTSQDGLSQPDLVLSDAKNYLAKFPISSEYLITSESIPRAISTLLENEPIDLILIGGYGGNTLLPVMLGSVVDQVLREIQIPVLICR